MSIEIIAVETNENQIIELIAKVIDNACLRQALVDDAKGTARKVLGNPFLKLQSEHKRGLKSLGGGYFVWADEQLNLQQPPTPEQLAQAMLAPERLSENTVSQGGTNIEIKAPLTKTVTSKAAFLANLRKILAANSVTVID
ncbi:hypothetical protein SAMN04488038_11926 [Solimonas aquatica]|uniref:Uncharacterized protein n=1 Tax=Solimonas aquatica TaxID=489703 RepID=A0A1H9M650_9GAMM|nr:hypothetical protein [Solimonas aquatica]SER19240.1 hypothetical protein SAMN04488038_11926 [Solimonas aquatica]